MFSCITRVGQCNPDLSVYQCSQVQMILQMILHETLTRQQQANQLNIVSVLYC